MPTLRRRGPRAPPGGSDEIRSPLSRDCGRPAGAAGAEPAARYQVTFERTWSSGTHPKDFPLLAHFSPVIGVTHGADFSLFRKGSTATAGMEHLCEEGKHQPLDAELRAAITAGGAGALIETADPLRSVPGSATSVSRSTRPIRSSTSAR